ncbi:MAG: cell division protein FtsQ/DivIB [Patescibacteria group bacterium]
MHINKVRKKYSFGSKVYYKPFLKRKKSSTSFSKNKHKNPFFQNKRRSNFSQFLTLKIKLIIISVFIVSGGCIYFFCFTNFFIIKQIEITGLTKLTSAEIEEIAWQQTNGRRFIIGSQKNIFLFNETKLINTLNSSYGFDQIIITKKIPNLIKLELKEKSYAFIWHENEKYYYTDINGSVINEVSPLEITGKKYPLIYNETNNQIINNKIGVDIRYVDYVLKLFNEFKSSNEIIIERFIIDQELNTIKMVIISGPQVYFNIEEDLTKQINKLLVVKKEKLKDDFNKKSYIDLRFGDRVYYR